MTVLGSPSVDHDILAVISFEREADFEDSMTGADDAQVATDLFPFLFQTELPFELLDQLVLDDLPPPVEVVLDHVKEGWIISVFDITEVLGDLMRLYGAGCLGTAVSRQGNRVESRCCSARKVEAVGGGGLEVANSGRSKSSKRSTGVSEHLQPGRE